MEKICVISGGTSGLGLEIAKLLLKSGKNVLVLGRSNEKSKTLPEFLRSCATTISLKECNAI